MSDKEEEEEKIFASHVMQSDVIYACEVSANTYAYFYNCINDWFEWFPLSHVLTVYVIRSEYKELRINQEIP